MKAKDNDATFVVDVGFGANGLFSPIEFKNSATSKGIGQFETFTLRNEPLPGMVIFSSLFFYISLCLLIYSLSLSIINLYFNRTSRDAKWMDPISIT